MNGAPRQTQLLSTLGCALNPVMIPTNMSTYTSVEDKLMSQPGVIKPFIPEPAQPIPILKDTNASY